jgi:hypothetical protein
MAVHQILTVLVGNTIGTRHRHRHDPGLRRSGAVAIDVLDEGAGPASRKDTTPSRMPGPAVSDCRWRGPSPPPRRAEPSRRRPAGQPTI